MVKIYRESKAIIESPGRKVKRGAAKLAAPLRLSKKKDQAGEATGG